MTKVCLSMALVALLSLAVVQGHVHVYIHAGQGNMEGHGSIEHLDRLITNSTWSANFSYWKNQKGGDDEKDKWTEMPNVYCRYNWNERIGKLTVGFGFRTHKFGPELGFGYKMGMAYKNDRVVILKATYGMASLQADFRPPSAGPIVQPSAFQRFPVTLYNDDGKADPSLKVGHRYKDMIALVQDSLANLTDIIPDFNQEEETYSIDGFVWFHGLTDTHPVPSAEYHKNLVHLMQDVRRDLNLSKEIPFIIGELGMQGSHPHRNHVRIRQIQRSVADTYRENTIFVPTARYVPDDTSDFDGDGPGSFHYHDRADTFYNIGMAFGNAMLKYKYNPTGTKVGLDKVEEENWAEELEREASRNLSVGEIIGIAFGGAVLFCVAVFILIQTFASGGRTQQRRRRRQQRDNDEAEFVPASKQMDDGTVTFELPDVE